MCGWFVWNAISSNAEAIGTDLFQGRIESIKQFESGKRYTGIDLAGSTMIPSSSHRADLGRMVGARGGSVPGDFQVSIYSNWDRVGLIQFVKIGINTIVSVINSNR